MKVVFVPVYRTAVNYAVSFGRRWSVLEQLLLSELASQRRSTADLAQLTDMPDRLIIEALINLLRATWIEVRSTENGTVFAATAAGKKLAKEEFLPAELQRAVKWTSLCLDRLTGSWLRADEALELVHDRDLPEDPYLIDPKIHTYDPNDGRVRDFFYLNQDESLDPSLPNFRTPTRVHARVEVAFGKVIRGLPSDASIALKQAVLLAAMAAPEHSDKIAAPAQNLPSSPMRDSIHAEDIIVGGPAHLVLIKECLANTKSHLVLHSCFVSPETIQLLLPDFEKAARRKVQIELLWGLQSDPEKPETKKSIAEADKVLNALPVTLRPRVQLSPLSSGSHAKIVVYDDAHTGKAVSIVGSCNFLSSNFDWIEASVRCRSPRLATQLLARLMAAQLPAAGSWSATARRLNRLWSKFRHDIQGTREQGTHQITLLSDHDHYACVTSARDAAQRDLVLGCDLYGVAAETTVLVPLERVAEMGRKAKIVFSRPSKLLLEEGRVPDGSVISKRGIEVNSIPNFHAKFLCWDSDALVVTSFNWLATVVEGTRSRGAEFGLLIEGSDVREVFAEKLKTESENKIDFTSAAQSVTEAPLTL